MKGTVVSSGMAFARAFIIAEPEISVQRYETSGSEGELLRLASALNECSGQFDALIGGIDEETGAETIEILEFQQLMLEDTDLLDKIKSIITQDNLNCEYAAETVFGEYIKYLQGLTDNDYLKERAADIYDLRKRLLCVLLGVSTEINEPEEPYIAVAADIAPSLMAGLDESRLKGIVLEQGGRTSHCVILANSLGIPCLIDTKGILEAEIDGKPLLLDAVTGNAVSEPAEEQISEYTAYKEGYAQDQLALKQYIDAESKTKDGAVMNVFANITALKEADALIEQGAEGVGLFRTELLYMTETLSPPSEDKQYDVYYGVASKLGSRPLIIRTLDVGGDKEIDYLGIEKEANPFLGCRAIRYCLNNPDFFKTQISAILRAGVGGSVQMMLPMIACKAEILKTRQIIKEVESEFDGKSVPYYKDMKVGIMVETPAAVFDCERLAGDVDFFSIGTNDLAQYLFAADRTNAGVSELNSFYQPGLIRAIYKISNAAHSAGIDVDICGQAGELLELIPLWIAMGITAVSVSIPQVTRVRRAICAASKADCKRLLDAVLDMDTAEDVERALCRN